VDPGGGSTANDWSRFAFLLRVRSSFKPQGLGSVVWLRVSAAKFVEFVEDLVPSRRVVCEVGGLDQGISGLGGDLHLRDD